MADQQTTVTTSAFMNLNWRDIIQGGINAAIGAVLGLIYPWLESLGTPNAYSLNWKLVGGLALAGFLSHVLRKLFQPPVIVIANPPAAVMQAVKNDEADVKVVSKSPPNAPINYTTP